MNRNMRRGRNREQRARPVKRDPRIVTVTLTRLERERLDELIRSRKCSCEDVFRAGLAGLRA